jgi:hypothetical protein
MELVDQAYRESLDKVWLYLFTGIPSRHRAGGSFRPFFTVFVRSPWFQPGGTVALAAGWLIG